MAGLGITGGDLSEMAFRGMGAGRGGGRQRLTGNGVVRRQEPSRVHVAHCVALQALVVIHFGGYSWGAPVGQQQTIIVGRNRRSVSIAGCRREARERARHQKVEGAIRQR